MACPALFEQHQIYFKLVFMKKFKLISLISAALVTLAACGGRGGNSEDVSRLVARIPAASFPGNKVEIEEHIPQLGFNGRGYSYTATLNSQVGFDIVTLPMARVDILAAGHQFCELNSFDFSRFYVFEQTREGVNSYTLFFNCG